MATKQDIDKGAAIHLGGTVPAGHCLHPIRQALLERPRDRQHLIGEVVSAHEKVDHPPDAETRRAPILQFVEMVAVTDPADIQLLAEIAKRARHASPPPGQARLDLDEDGDDGD